MAKSAKKVHKNQTANESESLAAAFWSGFFWPVRASWKGLAWLTHRFPLRHIGHAIRWFFALRAVRFIGKLLGIRYVMSSWKELRQVTWPTFKESRRLTSAVIIFSIMFGLLIALTDFLLDKLFKQFLLK